MVIRLNYSDYKLEVVDGLKENSVFSSEINSNDDEENNTTLYYLLNWSNAYSKAMLVAEKIYSMTPTCALYYI